MYQSYPLQWPTGYKKTPWYNRRKSKFKQTMEAAQNFLRSEVARIGGSNLVISTNVPTRLDGGLYADWMKKKVDDPGVAIYFKRKSKEISLCCDTYQTVWENIYALGKGIEALRSLERHDISEFLDRAFTGFTALPASVPIIHVDIWEILGLTSKPASVDQVYQAYKSQAKKKHPDAGGSTQAFQELQDCYQKALRFFQ